MPDCGAGMRIGRTWKPARERRGAGLCGWSCEEEVSPVRRITREHSTDSRAGCVALHPARGLLVQLPDGAGAVVHHDLPERPHGRRLPTRPVRDDDMRQTEEIAPA